MRIVLRNARWVYTGKQLLEHAHVLVTDERIESVQGEPIALPADETIDLDGCLLLPGLISLHHHFFQHLTRAWPGLHRAASENWLVGLYPVWAQMSAEDIGAAARNAAAELLLSGTTTCADQAFLLRASGDERLAAQVEAVRGLGLRLHLARSGLPSIGGRVESRLSALLNGRLDSIIDAEGPFLEQCRADVKRWHDPSPGSMLRLDFGPSNVTYDKPQLMRSLAELAAEHGCGLHAHFHPRPTERELCQRLNGVPPLDFLDQSGWLRSGTWFAHGTELDDTEIECFAERGVGIVLCPRTVMRLGYKIPPLHRWRRAGIKVGLGADGGASNDAGAFLSDVRLAMLFHRAGTADTADPQIDWLTPEDTLAMATRDAAAILRRPELGTIAPGFCADLAAFDLRTMDLAGALNDPLAGFLLAGSQTRAKLTMVNGRIRVLDGHLVDADEAQIASITNARALRLASLARRAHQ